jgi:hypothetical protein
MEQITAQPTMTAGAASYPPAWNAPSARLERAYNRYIEGRVSGDSGRTDLARNTIESVLRQIERGA